MHRFDKKELLIILILAFFTSLSTLLVATESPTPPEDFLPYIEWAPYTQRGWPLAYYIPKGPNVGSSWFDLILFLADVTIYFLALLFGWRIFKLVVKKVKTT